MENRVPVKKHISTWIPASITPPRQLATTNILRYAPTKACPDYSAFLRTLMSCQDDYYIQQICLLLSGTVLYT